MVRALEPANSNRLSFGRGRPNRFLVGFGMESYLVQAFTPEYLHFFGDEFYPF